MEKKPLNPRELKALTDMKKRIGHAELFNLLVENKTLQQLSDEAILAEVKVKIWTKMRVGTLEMSILEQLIDRFTKLRWPGLAPPERKQT